MLLDVGKTGEAYIVRAGLEAWPVHRGQTMGLVINCEDNKEVKGDRWGSNPQPLEPQSRALPS